MRMSLLPIGALAVSLAFASFSCGSSVSGSSPAGFLDGGGYPDGLDAAGGQDGQSQDDDALDWGKDGVAPGHDTLTDSVAPGDSEADGGGVPVAGVKTSAPDKTVRAGEGEAFTCTLTGVELTAGWTFELVVEGPGETDGDGLSLTFYKAGVYFVHCLANNGPLQLEDKEGYELEVTPALPKYIQTTLSKDAVMAGEKVEVTCKFLDEFGNLIENPPSIDVAPHGGLDVIATTLLAKKTGAYNVSCVEPESGFGDTTPARLQVSNAPPFKISTSLSAETMLAGQTVTVGCRAEDAWGNQVLGFKMVVYLTQGLNLTGFKVGGTLAGYFKVLCVPQDEPWNYFKLEGRTLHVLPAAAAAVRLDAVPDKPYYKVLENVSFQASAVDQFGNVVEGVEFGPMVVLPPDPAIKQTGPMRFQLGVEGLFSFVICLKNQPGTCGSKQVAVDGYGPVITIDYPPRAASLTGSENVLVTGSVVDRINGVAGFRINGASVPVGADGSFQYPILAENGLNIIVAVGEDPAGHKTVLIQSFYFSPVWLPLDDGNMIDSGMSFFLSEEFLDDGNHDKNNPNDLATLLEITLGSLDLGSFIPSPVTQQGYYKIYLRNVRYSNPGVKLFSDPGVLITELTFKNLAMDIDAIGKCKVLFIDLCPDVSGTVSVADVGAYVKTAFAVQNGVAKATSHDTNVTLSGINISLSNSILNFLFGWLVNWIANQYAGLIEDAAVSMVNQQLDGLIASLVGALAMNLQMPIPNPLSPDAAPVSVNFSTKVWSMNIDQDGLLVDMKADAKTGKVVNHDVPGTYGRPLCEFDQGQEFSFNKLSNTEVALHDNLLNRIFFSAWYAGMLNMVVPIEKFVDPATMVLEGFGTLADLGISNIVASTDFYLPPIINSCAEDGALTLQVGDAYVDLNMMMMGEPVSIGVFASMACNAELNLDNTALGQRLSLKIDKFDPLLVQVVYISENLKGAEGFMTMIVQAVILPQILGALTQNALASFELPEIKLADISNKLPKNLALGIFIDELYHHFGRTGMNARIKANTF